jgi:sugar lactone lactonase YvrE
MNITRSRFGTTIALLTVLAGPFAFAPRAHAQSTTIGSVPALAGSVTSVPVDLAVTQTIRGLSFRLDYDASRVSFFKTVLEGLGEDWFASASAISSSAVRVTLTPGTPRTANGRVASLVFTVSPAASASTAAALRISEVTLLFPDGSSQPGTGTDGGIQPRDQLARPVPPFPPTVSAVAESSSTIRLTWNQPPGATSFVVNAGGAKIYEGSEQSFVRTNLSPSTQYCFNARAVGAAGPGPLSSNVCATTRAQCVAPGAAPSLTAAALGTSRVRLSWTTATDASEYRLSRGATQVYAGTETTFTHEGLAPGTNHCYTIRAASTCGTGPASAEVCATTEAACAPPAATPSPRVTAVSQAVVAVEWDDVPGATSYQVTRGSETIFEGPSRRAVDVGLLPGTQYCYVVRALNACGERSSTSACSTTADSVNETPVFAHLAGSTGGADARDGVGTGAGFARPASVAVDSSGNVWVADTDNQTIRRISPAGIVTTIAGSPEQPGSDDGTGAAAKFFGPEGVAVDAAGNGYVADAQNATIRRITPDGTVSTFAGKAGVRGASDGPVSTALFHTPVGVAVDSSGTVWVSDSWNHTIRRIANGQVTTVAGSAGQSGSVDGTGAAARFNLPAGIAVDASGNVFVADYTNHTIRRVTPAGVVTTIAGSAGTSGSTNGTGSGARFRQPTGVAVDSGGNVYVADQSNSTIRRITPAGVVTTFAGTPDNVGSVDGVGSAARFFLPKQVGTDSSGNVWVADTGNSTVRRITPAASVTTIAGSANQSGYQDGTGNAVRFNVPQQIAIDGSGAIVVSDSGNHLIRRVSGATASTVAGTPEIPGTTDGPAASARFRDPLGVAIDPSGNTYVADWGNHTIRRIAPNGTVTTFAGSPGQSGTTDGSGAAARFHGPRALAAGADGSVWVTDRENHTIRRITPAGAVSTIAGSPGQSGNADGTGSAARFTFPHGIATETNGNLIVSDWGNHTVRRVTPAGVVTTLAGSPGVSGVADGVGAVARFSGPQGVAVDADGDIWITDSWNHTIRRLDSSGAVTTVAGMPRSVGSRDGRGSASRFSNPIGIATAGDAIYVADTLNHAIRRVLPCPANALCLGDGRFTLSLEAKDPRTGNVAGGLPIPQTDLFGYFAIPGLTGNPDNPEVFVKLLDGRAINGSHWVFYGGLTDFEYDLVVTDSSSGGVRVYRKPGLEFCGGADTAAFSTDAPALLEAAGGSSAALSSGFSLPENTGECDPSTELCLLGGRFALSLTAKDPRTGNTGPGLPIPQADLFGYYSIPALTSNPDNPEIFVKVLDGRGVNGRYWVFYGGLTDFEVTLVVRDTQSGATKTYTKQGGSFCGGADTGAF